MPNVGLILRRSLRLLQSQSPLVRGLSLANALLLVIGAVTVGVRLGDDDGPRRELEFVGEGDDEDEVGLGDEIGTTLPGETTTSTTARRTRTTSGGTTATTTGGGGGGGGGETVDLCATGALTASDRGVSEEKIKVVFPWFDPTAAFAITGGQEETPEDYPKTIDAMVKAVNAVGICGRKIEPLIREFNPLNEADMDAKCRQWANDDKVFAVVDSAAWHGSHQLCVAQDQDLPLISEWVTVPEEGAAKADDFLWWTAPDSRETINNWVIWAHEKGLISPSIKVGIAAGDRPFDAAALRVMRDALGKVGITPTHEARIAFDPATGQAQASVEMTQMKNKGVQVVFPLISFVSFSLWLNQIERQWDSPGAWRPRHLLSDYESTIVVGEAVIGPVFPKALNGSPGPSFLRLGEWHAPKRYAPAEQRCNDAWKAAYPKAQNLNNAGVGMRYCQNVFLFAEAARRAGRNLTRESWSEAMKTISSYESPTTPMLSFGPGNWSGPTMVRDLELRTDGKGCEKQQFSSEDDRTCYLIPRDFHPMAAF